jgi:hypothetical protein
MVAAYCEHCNTIFHIERTSLTGRVGPFLFCTLCGKRGITLLPDITPDDYWTQLGREYDMPPELMQEIFQTWDTSKHRTFREHVESLRAEALSKVAS